MFEGPGRCFDAAGAMLGGPFLPSVWSLEAEVQQGILRVKVKAVWGYQAPLPSLPPPPDSGMMSLLGLCP